MKAAFHKMNRSIRPAPGMKDRVLDQATGKETLHLRPLAAVAAMLVVVMLATPAMAATIPAVSDWLYQVSPEMAARFTPINKSCTKNGITMEVVSASIHGATAEICIGFTDRQGNRLNRNSMPELFETRFLGRLAYMSGTWGGGINEMEYDEDTGTLYMVMERNFSFYSKTEQRYLDVAELYGKKLTVSTDVLYENVTLPEEEIPVELTNSEIISFNLREDREAMQIGRFGFGSNASNGSWVNQEAFEIIALGEPVCYTLEELTVTGMTYIDGKLHIQTCIPGNTNGIPVYDIWFEDSQGNRTEETENLRFTVDGGKHKGSYEENIFDIAEEELKNYKLMCQLSEKKTIEGPWQVTFAFEESDYVGEHVDGVPLETSIG